MKNFSKIPISSRYFYVAAGATLELLDKHLSEFADYNATYTPAYAAELNTKLQNALALPSTTSAIAKRKQSRIFVKNGATALREKFQALKRIIERSFAADSVKAQLEVAGWSYFMNMGENWGNVQHLGEAAKDYIAANVATLKIKGNMPDKFEIEFNKLNDDFNKALNNFSAMDIQKVDDVAVKNKAVTELYESIIDISKDAAVVFQKDRELRRQFSFSYRVAVIRGGSARFKGYVTDADGMPLEGVLILGRKYEARTDAKGYFDISRIAAGEYTFDFYKEGYLNIKETVTLSVGTSKTLRIQMAVALQAVA